MQQIVRVWDGFVRSFHWLLVVLLIGLWLTGGDFEYIDLHQNLGLVVLALIISRIMWGLMGSQTARFTDFVRTPWQGFRYLRDELGGRAPHIHGHNPAGAWMILLLLAMVLAQAVSGLFTNDDLFFMGPLANWVEYDTQRWLTRFHRNHFDWLLIAIAIHVVVIFVYMARGKDLLTAMFTGSNKLPDTEQRVASPQAEVDPTHTSSGSVKQTKAYENASPQVSTGTVKPKLVNGWVGIGIFAFNLVWVFWWLG